MGAQACLLRKQRTTSCERRYDWRALVSTPRSTLLPEPDPPFAQETAITATCQMSVYNFCRRRSACPAGTQCQSETGYWKT